ncbi:tubulin--tyrosine ligase-like protein 12 isoform X2 [Halichondria panicea]|uniref:tubulin--tyrosine ligase-like protein 12 isoform X2 n=1 Tax=Halichondria panicea TaxID=6063 RepID=UPI00312B2BF0
MDYGQFLHSHGAQLERIPQMYWEALHAKLSSEDYDAGGYFTMSCDEENGWRVCVSNKDGLSKDSPNSVFLVDHAWTFQPPSVRGLLATVPGLANRMAALMNIVQLPCVGDEDSDSYDADSESGDEKRESSDSSQDVLSPVNQSESSSVAPPITMTTHDGYSSVNLGDATVTEDRYKIAQLEGKVQELAVESSNQITDQSSSQPSNEIIDAVTRRMWRYCHAYHVNNSPLPIWYIMDEFGSRIQQSWSPSVAMAMFFYIPSQLAFTAVWPLRDMAYEEVTCNYVPECVKEGGLEAWCHSLPWTGDDVTMHDDWEQLEQFNTPEPSERCNEDTLTSSTPPPHKLSYTVHTDIKVVQLHLTIPEFKVQGGVSAGEADILWLAEHFKQFKSLRPHQYVNQFPCENMITCKDLMVLVAKRAGETPPWLPLTFNLLYELPRFVKCFTEKKKSGEEANVWIVKPWNLGRGMGITVTDNLMEIIRLAQIGPKIACRYISRPVLFRRDDIEGWVKFDVRYNVLLKSVSPLELFVHDVFWLRFANKPFSLDDFHDYEKHFTVMNYTQGGTKLKQIHDVDFIRLFESMYPATSWSSVQDKMFSVIKELFTAAVSGQPPAALAPCHQARAMYGLDMMLEWGPAGEMEPMLIEVNYCPDCTRVCKHCPQFYNHVFQTLFDIPGASPPVTRLI